MHGLYATFLGYAIAAVPVLVMTNASASHALRLGISLLSVLLLVLFCLVADFPDNLLFFAGYATSTFCTFMQVESWKMFRSRRRSSVVKKAE